MDITPLIPQGRQIIQNYSENGFKVSGVAYPSAIIVTPSDTILWAVSGDFSVLEEKDFTPLIDLAKETDVILLGCGKKGGFFPPKLRQALRDKGLLVDVMDSGAACRTYNVLMAEGRRVACALLPLK